jgi:hypothetical protein
MRTRMNAVLAVLCLSSSGFVGACGDTPTNDDTPAAPQSSAVITTLNVDGFQHTFVYNGDSIGIEVFGPESRGLPMVFRLLQQDGDLTSLELFRGMAPAGTPVDPRFLAVHQIEVAAMGRADTGVRAITLDPAAAIEKGSQANCQSWATTKRGGLPPVTIGSSPTGNSTLTMSSTAANNHRVAAAICNTSWSSSDSGLSANVDRKIGSGSWTQVGSVADSGHVFVLPANGTANDNNSWAYTEGQSASNRIFRINGFFLGTGHLYYLAIAY